VHVVVVVAVAVQRLDVPLLLVVQVDERVEHLGQRGVAGQPAEGAVEGHVGGVQCGLLPPRCVGCGRFPRWSPRMPARSDLVAALLGPDLASPEGAPGPVEARGELVELGVGGAPGGRLGQVRLDQLARLQQVEDRGGVQPQPVGVRHDQPGEVGPHVHAGAMPHLDRAGGLEAAQGLAQRRGGDQEALGERPVGGQAVAGAQALVADVRQDPVGHFVEKLPPGDGAGPAGASRNGQWGGHGLILTLNRDQGLDTK
jgi:hypothetical protein